MHICGLSSYGKAVLFGAILCATRFYAYGDVVDIAATFVDKPYHLGCKDPNGTGVGGQSCEGGFDCTGLVQYSYGQVGIKLPPSAQYLDLKVTLITDQRCANPTNCALQELITYGIVQRGDLLWFDSRTGFNPNNKVTGHVGIYESGTTMINAFSDILNPHGIRRDDLLNAQAPVGPNYWKDRFMFAGHVRRSAAPPPVSHHWALDGNGNDSIGSVALQDGGTPQYVSGLVGMALNAHNNYNDGNNNAVASYLYDNTAHIARGSDGSFYFSVWYKHGTGQAGAIVSYGVSEVAYHRMVLFPDNGGYFDFVNHSWTLNSGVDLKDGKWHNIVFSFNGSTTLAQAWVDDVSGGTVSIPFALNASNNFGIGLLVTILPGLPSPFGNDVGAPENDYIDDVYFGTSPLTQTDVDRIWNGGAGGSPNG